MDRAGFRRLAAAAWILAGWAGTQAAPPPPDPVPRAEAVEFIFGLRLGPVTLNEAFPAFTMGERTFLPLGELCRELDLAIQVDPAHGLADGFLIAESRRFSLDAKAATVTVAGTTRAFDPSLLAARSDDLYLDTQLLAQCLPLDIAVARRSLVVTVTPREPLPMQLRWQREEQEGRMRHGDRAAHFPPLADPYRLCEFPAVDLALGLQAGAQGDASGLSGQGSILATGDLARMSASGYALIQTPDGLRDFHLTMGRRDPHGGLLGPLGATEFAFGEVLDPGLDLVAAPTTGTGFLLGNFPLQGETSYDRHSFQGDLAQGWQVELYRNQTLIAFQASRPDGLYQFLEVPVYFGFNSFRLVFYGPQGQRRTELLNYDVGANQTPAGSWHYHLAGLNPRGLPGSRKQVEFSYGLSEQLTAAFGATSLNLDGVGHSYAEAGLQGFWKPLSASLTACRDDQGGSVAELAVRTRLGPLSLAGRTAELMDGFHSEVFQDVNGPIRRRIALESLATLPSLDRAWGSIEWGGYRDDLLAGGSSDHVVLGLATALSGVYLTNRVTRNVVRDAPGQIAVPTTGTLLASTFLAGCSLRGQADYTLTGARQLADLILTAETTRYEPCAYRAVLSHSTGSGENVLDLGAIRSQGGFGFGANLAYSTLNHLSASFTFRLGLGREPRAPSLFTRAAGTARFGSVSAQAFLDGNGNGIRDPGEKPVPGVGFLVNGASRPVQTDAQGVAVLEGLPLDQDAEIAVNPATLDDPLMRPAHPGIQVIPRQGHVVMLDLPMVYFGEITGTVYALRDGRKAGWPGVRMELRDGAGRVVKSLRTAHDGFYDFSELPPGTYTLVVAGTGTPFQAPPPRVLRLAPEGTVLDGLDILLDQPPVVSVQVPPIRP